MLVNHCFKVGDRVRIRADAANKVHCHFRKHSTATEFEVTGLPGWYDRERQEPMISLGPLGCWREKWFEHSGGPW